MQELCLPVQPDSIKIEAGCAEPPACASKLELSVNLGFQSSISAHFEVQVCLELEYVYSTVLPRNGFTTWTVQTVARSHTNAQAAATVWNHIRGIA